MLRSILLHIHAQHPILSSGLNQNFYQNFWPKHCIKARSHTSQWFYCISCRSPIFFNLKKFYRAVNKEKNHRPIDFIKISTDCNPLWSFGIFMLHKKKTFFQCNAFKSCGVVVWQCALHISNCIIFTVKSYCRIAMLHLC